MPVEIRELVIRAEATEDCGPEETAPDADDVKVNMEALIQEAVRRVLQVLQRQKER